MLDYTTVEWLNREFWNSVFWDDNARILGGRYSIAPIPSTLIDDVNRCIYDLMTEMFCRQKNIADDLRDHAERYVRGLVCVEDASAILLACLLGDEPYMIYPQMFYGTTYEQVWESGVAELLDSYLSGIPLEQVIG